VTGSGDRLIGRSGELVNLLLWALTRSLDPQIPRSAESVGC
jgi:hypothetical protein